MQWNQVIHGDCLVVLSVLGGGFADLAYLDPPFNTGRTMHASNGRYSDRWADVASYLSFLRPRVEAVHRALRQTGSILLHCDWRTCHHARLLLDDVFGAENFINHLVWHYGLGGSSPRRFARKHDDILFYGKGPEYYFEAPMVRARSNRMKGMRKKASDVIDVPSINNMARERVGYPTQKPLSLLAMLVEACCPKEGMVLDPFCGSGTSLLAAKHGGRRYVGIDQNPQAVKIARRRCANRAGSSLARQ
ncbi:MAG: site-specific DNA-methyltransferase [Phycisphaerales bacterium]|nr:site-specific DNA-methyltransferase [Phycisphaerales bacterium]MCI0632169.1 site-specific DNA-methyltransferase [Phycisphaerales bacterium]MCI0677140.1 site-specific DNA-methyltransferase [Phycisphaerales bacterium]